VFTWVERGGSEAPQQVLVEASPYTSCVIVIVSSGVVTKAVLVVSNTIGGKVPPMLAALRCPWRGARWQRAAMPRCALFRWLCGETAGPCVHIGDLSTAYYLTGPPSAAPGFDLTLSATLVSQGVLSSHQGHHSTFRSNAGIYGGDVAAMEGPARRFRPRRRSLTQALTT